MWLLCEDFTYCYFCSIMGLAFDLVVVVIYIKGRVVRKHAESYAAYK